MILISGPAIAPLFLRTRKWANDHLRRGTFGPVIRSPSGILYAELPSVEAEAGHPFTEQQLARAIAGHRDRCIILPKPRSEHGQDGCQG